MARQHLKKRKDGRYACRYKDQWFMGNTESEVLEAREAYKLQEKMGMRKDAAHTTVADYASQWLPVHKHGVDKKAYNDYAKQIDALLDAIGSMNIQEVKPSDIQHVWLHYDGYSDSTIKRNHQLFFSMFDTACDDGYIRVNPMKSKHAHPPKGTIGTHRAITNDERQLILANSQHFFHPVIMVMLYAGLRRGEALALNLETGRRAISPRCMTHGCSQRSFSLLLPHDVRAAVRQQILAERVAGEAFTEHFGFPGAGSSP